MQWYPRGRERPRGTCRVCGGPVVVRFSDRFNGEYHCTNCGLQTTHAGKMQTVSRRALHEVIDEAYDILTNNGVRRVDLQTFLTTVDKACLKINGRHIPVVRKKELAEWGYEIVGQTIKRIR